MTVTATPTVERVLGRQAPPTPVSPPVTVSAVGDLCFMGGGHNPLGDPATLLAAVSPHLAARDLTFGNLETAVSDRGKPEDKTFTFRAPTSAAASLASTGFDVVSLANNHSGDYGGDAFRDTLTAVSAAGLVGVGGGVNREEAWSPRIVEAGGRGAPPVRIAFLAFNEILPENFAATESRPGNTYTQDLQAILGTVAAARPLADYLIVSMHWGIERQFEPTERQVREAHALIDAGVDVVLGHHPHVIEGIEFYGGGLIAYSLGNFVFSPGSAQGRDTYVLDFTLSPGGISDVAAYPAYISGASPVFVSGAEFGRIGGLIAQYSRQRGAAVEIAADSVSLRPAAGAP
ncbi:MAG: CapA family protein [Bifidobacteriaceae bacterium]|nr:CapA family protein [Bifidobacteriaceae bacterium]